MLTLLAADSIIQRITTRFANNLDVGLLSALLAALGISFYIIVQRRVYLALLCMLTVGLFTAAENEAVSSAALLGRWYFLGLACLVALTRIGPGAGAMFGLTAAWAALNLIGAVYSPGIEQGFVRGLYFSLILVGVMMSFGPPHTTTEDVVKFIRGMALSGALLALLHLIFLAKSGGAGLGRYTSFYAASQPMSLATATVCLPMIWTLLSKRGGKLFPLILGGLLINIIVLIASTQRTAMFSLAGATAIMLMFYQARGAILAVVVGAGIVLIVVPVAKALTSQEFVAERFGSLDTKGRYYMWQIAFKEAMGSPIIGHGSGAATYFGQGEFGRKFHQAYLAVFYDFGVVGLFVFLAMIASGTLYGLGLARSRDPTRKSIGVFTVAALAMVSATGLVETGLADTANQTAVLLYFSLAMAAGVSRLPEQARGFYVIAQPAAQPREAVPVASNAP